MKHLYLAVLLIFGLLLAGCGDTATPEAQPEAPEPAALEQVSFDIEGAELSVQAPGQPIVLNGLIGTRLSFGINTPPQDGLTGGTDLARHFNSVLQIVPVFENDANFEADATWTIAAPLATDDPSCFSMESVNFPGSFVRHAGSRVRIDPNDGSALFAGDATWCTRFSLNGVTDTGDLGTFSYESFNFPGQYMRRFNNEVWLSAVGGPLPSDNPAGFADDASWGFFQPALP